MIEMRWLITRDQFQAAFSEPLEWPDGTTVYARLQYREKGLAGGATWLEIPTISEILTPPSLALVKGRLQ